MLVGALLVTLVVTWGAAALAVWKFIKYKTLVSMGLTPEHHNELHEQLHELSQAVMIFTIIIELHNEQGHVLNCSDCGKELEIGPGMSGTIGVGQRSDGTRILHCPDCAPIPDAPDTIPDEWWEEHGG